LRSCTVSKERGSPRLFYYITRRRRRKSYLCATAIPHSSLTSKHDRIDIILPPLSLSLTHTHKRIRKHQLKTANPPSLFYFGDGKIRHWNGIESVVCRTVPPIVVNVPAAAAAAKTLFTSYCATQSSHSSTAAEQGKNDWSYLFCFKKNI